MNIESLDNDIDDIEKYLGEPYEQRGKGETLTDLVKEEYNNEFEQSKPEIKDFTLQHMAHAMLDAFGNKD